MPEEAYLATEVKNLLSRASSGSKPDMDEYNQMQLDLYNRIYGDLDGYDCPKCLNKGNYHVLVNGEIITRVCDCMKVRRAYWNLQDSGLKDLVDRYRYDNFRRDTPWRDAMYKAAQAFERDKEQWLYIGGQPGCGKTHICTAAVADLLKRGVPARYMIWREEVVRLRALVNDHAEYARIIKPYEDVKVLYIDDFFKAPGGKDPTDGDINIAYNLINHRYNKRLKTIISSERSLMDITRIDEAIGSRIAQMAQGMTVVIGRDPGKNFRMTEGKSC